MDVHGRNALSLAWEAINDLGFADLKREGEMSVTWRRHD